MKSIFYTFLLVFTFGTGFSQIKQNIILSKKYSFQKNENEYNINEMLKAIFLSNNFNVYFDDETLPEDIAKNNCAAYSGFLIDNSNVFLTKAKIQVKDCYNNLVAETKEVKSKEKNVHLAYIEIIQLLNIELKKVFVTLKLNSQKAIQKEQKQEIVEIPKIEEFKTFLNCKIKEVFNGFHETQIVNSEGFVLLNIQKTKNPNIFIANKENAFGVFTKSGNKGVFEYYSNEKYIVEEYSF